MIFKYIFSAVSFFLFSAVVSYAQNSPTDVAKVGATTVNGSTANTASPMGGQYGMIIMIIAVFALMYFMSIRPQQKQAKMHREFLSALTIGQEIITDSGIIGKITEIQDTIVVLDLGSSKIKLLKRNISSTMVKEPATK